MRKAKRGDHVRIHYRKRFDDGTWASSEKQGPIEVVVGDPHPRVPGLGLALVGLAPGEVASLRVPPEDAYGLTDPKKVRSLPRNRLPKEAEVGVGDRVDILKENGRKKSVRIVKLQARKVVVDGNHRWAGMTMDLEVELLEFREGPGNAEPEADRSQKVSAPRQESGEGDHNATG